MEKARLEYITRTVENRFLSTLPRAGSHYLVAMLSAWDLLEQGSDPSYRYIADEENLSDGRWAFSVEIGVPSDYKELINSISDGWYGTLSRSAIVCSHYPTFRKESYFDYKTMKAVVLIRDLLPASYSFYKYRFGEDYNQVDRFLDFNLDKLISFYNYWGRYKENGACRDNFKVVKYEDLIKNPLDTMVNLLSYWELDYNVTHIEKAIAMCRREEMLSKIPSSIRSENRRVGAVESHNLQDWLKFFNQQVLAYSKSRLSYDFDYEIIDKKD